MQIIKMRTNGAKENDIGETEYEVMFHIDDDGVLRKITRDDEYKQNKINVIIPKRFPTGEVITAIGTEVCDPDDIYGSIHISDGIEKVEIAAFKETKVDIVHWPRAAKEIPARCFEFCRLMAITGIEYVESIGEAAFANSGIIIFNMPLACSKIPKDCFKLSLLLKIMNPGRDIEYGPQAVDFTPLSMLPLINKDKESFIVVLSILIRDFAPWLQAQYEDIDKMVGSLWGFEPPKSTTEPWPTEEFDESDNDEDDGVDPYIMNLDEDLIEKDIKEASFLTMDEFLEVVTDEMRNYYPESEELCYDPKITSASDITFDRIKSNLDGTCSHDGEDNLYYLNEFITNKLSSDLTVDHCGEEAIYHLVTIKDGLPGIIAERYGDEESYVAVFIYSDDGKHLRAYIPKYGNQYDVENNEALEWGDRPGMQSYENKEVRDALIRGISEAICVNNSAAR